MSGYYLVEEYYAIEAEYEDGEPVGYGDILGVSEMRIEVIEKPSYDVVAAFDNFKDAEEAIDNYEGDGEVYLSYCE